MSLGSQDIAEARAARLEREHAETESRHDAEYDLSVLGFHGLRLRLILESARAQGEVMTEGDVRVRVEYRAGVYTVTR